MSIDELIENLVFSATYRSDSSVAVQAHEQAGTALVNRYGLAELRSAVMFMHFRVMSDKVRRSVEAAAADVLTASWAAS